MRQHGKAAAGRALRRGQRHVVVVCTPVSSVQVDSAFFVRGMEASLRRDDCRAGKTTRKSSRTCLIAYSKRGFLYSCILFL
jgi:hypothetical protein